MKYKKTDLIELDDEQLRHYQEQLLEIAKDVTVFFERCHIDYSLSGGSILGAIRHQGFIPWDDDIDLNMPRADYNRMLEIFDKELGDKYYLQTPQMYPEIGIMVTQIRKKGTVARRKYDWNINPCGISIDIYIIENVFNKPIKREIQKTMSMMYSFIISSVRFYKNSQLPKEIQMLEARKYQYPRLKMFVGRCLNIVPLSWWIRRCDSWNSRCKDSSTKLVAIPTGRKHFAGEIYERRKMCVFRKVPFETEYFNVPVWAKGYLKRFYGDYMAIPPVEKRERHVFLELKY